MACERGGFALWTVVATLARAIMALRGDEHSPAQGRASPGRGDDGPLQGCCGPRRLTVVISRV
jgi:hypothetical protein